MVESKRKKYHDKDKYYRLAKEQGLRSRAAFKLSQIHRTCPTFLGQAKHAVLDLCAAPGGWTQIAARTCPSTVRIVAVDILPIRNFGGAHRNVTTLIGDITTDACQSEIRRTLAGTPVDVVLCDGAPNIGANYARDSYVQNELVVHAMKCASKHLIPGGTFCTKVYRSRDYTALHWMLQQLFESVTAIKPTASRPASAEIFLLCRNYKAPVHLDPRLLDPKHVFASVEDEPAGDGETDGKKIVGATVFDKGWDKQVRRRGGYDMEHLDATMRHIEPVHGFVRAGWNDALRMLSTCTGLTFTCIDCNQQNTAKGAPSPPCQCRFLLHHPFTTTEIKACLVDLQVLNKADFKSLLTWRTKMQEALKAVHGDESGDDDDDDNNGAMDDNETKTKRASRNDDTEKASDADSEDSEREEEEIQKEMEEMRTRRQKEQKRIKKKERALAAKRRKHAALGMDLNAIDISDQDQIFSLASIPSAKALDAIHEVNLDQVTDEQLFGGSDNEADIVIEGGNNLDDEDDSDKDQDGTVAEERRRLRRERDLDEAYDQYLESTKNGMAVSGTKMAKRSKKAIRHKVALEAEQDVEMAMTGAATDSYEARTYAKMLRGADDSDDDDGSQNDKDDDEDGFFDDPMTPSEFQASSKAKQQMRIKNPLLHTIDDEPTSIKTARWFSNPLFASIGMSVESATIGNKKVKHAKDNKDDEEDAKHDDQIDREEPDNGKRKRSSAAMNRDRGNKQRTGNESDRLTADEVLASMPRTDKQMRHDKRLKQMERTERKKIKRAKKIGDTESEFQQVAADDSEGDNDNEDSKLEDLSESQKKRFLEARELIKAGLGRVEENRGISNDKSKIEIVSQEDSRSNEMNRPLPIMDERKYDSEHEDYDSDDYAKTLALGTMMLRRSKEKAFVDSSYNRYAWNDPSDLPEWFVDDENKNYKPQLPIPPALLEKMKEKMMALSAKPIAKVAEARARKNKRAKIKLAAAKKQAEAVANSTEMTEAMKLKAISKALTRGDDKRKHSGKQYVVAKKGRGSSGGVKGAKVVDKRLKSDKRSMDRVERKRKKGKQNGLVGSKKRRQHS